MLGLLCLAALGLRLLTLSQYESNHPLVEAPSIDERSYDEWAVEIAAGDWLGDEVFFQEPLYPYFLGSIYSLAGHDRRIVRLVQCLLSGLTLVLIWLSTRRLFGDTAAWVAGAGFAMYPPALLMPCLLLKPNLFMPLLAGLVLVLTGECRSWRAWLLAGVLAGLGALLRGNLLILLPLLALLPLMRVRSGELGLPRAIRSSALFGAGTALVLLPVMLRNWQVGEVLALTTSGAGTNVFGGNNEENPYGVATEFPWVRGIPRYEADDWRREAERRLDRELDPGESSSYWLGQALESMQANPRLHLSIFWNKLRLALGNYEVPDNHHLIWDSQYIALLRLRWPGFSVLGGFGLAGLLLALFRRQLGGRRLELALMFLAYLGTIVLTVVSMRARLPLVVLLLPFTGFWISELVREYRLPRESRSLGWLAMLVGLGMSSMAIVSTPVFDARTVEGDLADRDYNLAVSWLERDIELERAAGLAEELVGRHPRTSRFQTLLATTEWHRGRVLLDQGATDLGQGLIRDALERLRPLADSDTISPRERSRALRLAGYIQADIGNWVPAERFFRRSREFASEDLELKVSHAQALLEASQESDSASREQARVLLEQVVESNPASIEAAGASKLLSEWW